MTHASPSVVKTPGLKRLASNAEMRAMDSHAIETLGIPGRLLMENAAAAVADQVNRLLNGRREARITVLCGWGNNGGDGYAVSRLLLKKGRQVTVIALSRPASSPSANAPSRDSESVPSDALVNRQAWEQLGPCLNWPVERDASIEAIRQADILVDALFGTGLARPIAGEAASLIEMISSLCEHGNTPLIAVDIPSGIHGDSGQIMGCALRATHTVNLQVGKPGCWLYPGRDYSGSVTVVPISIPETWPEKNPGTYLLTHDFVGNALPTRPSDGHKGTFGHLLCVCGSAGMGGAALLAGRAALKSGTGLVTMGVPPALLDAFIAAAPELMTLSRPGTNASSANASCLLAEDAGFVLEAAASRTAVVLGCGLGRAESTQSFARQIATVDRPLLIDADGLYALAPEHFKQRNAPTVLTPHLGELSRLSGISVQDLTANRVEWARKLSGDWGVILVMKGAGTVVASPDGRIFINPTGDQALASGGTGDVLSGIIGGFLAQGCDPLTAALAGVYLHGLARDCQRELVNPRYFSASDLIAGMNPAFRLLEGQEEMAPRRDTV